MILINPYYLVLNIQFVDTRRKYIQIDKKVWNRTIVSLNRVRKLTNSDIKRFKKEIYNMYIRYMRTSKIDYNLFNQLCCDLVGIPWVSEKLVEVDETEVEVSLDENDMTVSGGFSYYESDNLIESAIDKGILDNKVYHKIVSVRQIQEQLTDRFNLEICKSRDRDDLFNYVGFGRIRGMLSQLVSSHSIKCHSEEEYLVLIILLDFIQSLFRTNNFEGLHFACEQCYSINTHDHFFKGRWAIQNCEAIEREHDGKVFFFDNHRLYGNRNGYKNEGKHLVQQIDIPVLGEEQGERKYHIGSLVSPFLWLEYNSTRNDLIQKYKSLIQRRGFIEKIDDNQFSDYISSLPLCRSYYYDKRPVHWELDKVFITKNFELIDHKYHHKKLITNSDNNDQQVSLSSQLFRSSNNNSNSNPFSLGPSKYNFSFNS